MLGTVSATKMIYPAISANCTQLAEAGTPSESNMATTHLMVVGAAVAVVLAFPVSFLVIRWCRGRRAKQPAATAPGPLDIV